MRDARGQATLEMLAVAPVLLALALVSLQLLAVGYTAVRAGTAAEAVRWALAGGGDAAAGAKASLPGWWALHARVESTGSGVTVRVRPPSALGSVGKALEITGHAALGSP